VLPEGACCEVCNQRDPALLAVYPLVVRRRSEPVVLCRNHAAPLQDTRSLEIPTRDELFAFWASRRPGVVWLSSERRQKRRRDLIRHADGDRRRGH
jgi:hypothetical protein